MNQQRLEAEDRLRKILDELELYNRKLQKESTVDEMTSLLNRRGFLNIVKDTLKKNQDNHTRFTLFFADMDGLKSINDTYGHAEGDRAIKEMSDILKTLFRQEDIIARLGGDEFTIFTLNVPEDLQGIIDLRLAMLLEKNRKGEDHPFNLSFSIGSVTAFTDESPLLEELMKQADEKLYIQKKRKKGL